MPAVENIRPFEVIDTTLRDGLQNPETPEHGKYLLTIEERLEIFTALVKYGVRYVEVFSPLVNSAEKESLAAILSRRDELSADYGYTFILGHVRCEDKDALSAIEGGVDGLNVYMGTSQESQEFNHGKSLAEVARRSRTLLENIHRDYPDLQLRFSGEDAFRTPMRDLYTVYDGISDTVSRFGMPDTVGVATPSDVRRRVRALKKRYPSADLEGHFHNDRGYAIFNAVTAALAGMRYMDTSVLGLAERSGITSLTGLFINLYLENRKLVTGFSLKDSYALNVLVANIMRMQVPYTEPVSLTNSTHSSGVHTGAMLKNKKVYQALPLEEFGVTDTRLLLGPLSGWHIVNYYLNHILNFEGVTDEVAKEITAVFKDKCANGSTNENPTNVLRQIGQSYNLKQKDKPVTHIEIL